MKIKTLKDFDLSQKRVILRVDFNLPLDENGKILSFYRVRAALESIRYLKNKGAKLIIISHLGRPEKIKNKKERLTRFSLRQIIPYFEKSLGQKVLFSPDCIGKKTEKMTYEMKGGEILLLENLRFYSEEEENNDDFAHSLSNLGDIYINEAFSVSHREHASIVSLPKYLPHGMGFLFSQEIENLSKVWEGKRPIVFIIGGAKISTKIRFVEKLIHKADYILLGGKLGEVIVQAKSVLIGKPLPPENVFRDGQKLDITSPKIHLPIDVVVSPNKEGDIYLRTTSLGNIRKEEQMFDIGKETIEFYSRFIREAKTIILAGPLGFFENKKFATGTRKIVEEISKNKGAFTIAGGGETLLFLEKNNFLDNFDFVSTGGAAMLGFLSGGKLPGIKALEN